MTRIGMKRCAFSLNWATASRQVRFRKLDEPQLRRLYLYEHEHSDIIKKTRDNRRFHNVHVRPADHLRYDEGRSAHDRRDKHTPRGRQRFDCPCHHRLVPGPYHQRYGERPHGRNIRRLTSGHHPEEAASQHSRLRRSSFELSKKA